MKMPYMKYILCIVALIALIQVGYPSTEKMASETDASGCVMLYFINDEDELYLRKQSFPAGPWSEDVPIASSVSAVCLYKDINGCLRMFYIGTDGVLWYRKQNIPDYSWTDFNEFAEDVQSVVCIEDASDLLNVYYITTSNELMHTCESSPGTWTTHARFADFARLVRAGINEDGRLEVFYTVSDQTLYHRYQLAPSGAWSDPGYFSLPAKYLELGQNLDGRLEVFFIDTSDKLYHKWQVAINSGWADPAIFKNHARKIIVGYNNDGRMEVFYTSNNYYIHHRSQTAPSSGWGTEEQCGWAAFEMTTALNADGCLEIFYSGNDDVIYHNWQMEPGLFWAGEYPFTDESEPLIDFEPVSTEPIYIPNDNWHVNDHCFIPDDDNYWHMFGIVYPDPFSGDDSYVNYFGHAGSPSLTAMPWTQLDPPFFETTGDGQVLWAPHVIRYGDTYYMFYCGGGNVLHAWEICMRTSSDLIAWSGSKVLFTDGIQARDPMVIWLEEEQHWVMYYTATSNSMGGYYVVAYRTSADLNTWSARNIAYTDYHSGNTYGNTESPFVVQRGPYYYLFIGPRPYDTPNGDFENWEHPGYVGTDIYRSTHWDQWTNADYVGHLEAHASEIVRDLNGDWYYSHCGVLQGGLFLGRLHWQDGINAVDFPEVKAALPGFRLSAFPNPYKTETEINYILDKSIRVRIEIIDATGRIIRILNDHEQRPGEHSAHWDGTDNSGNSVTSGLYICRLSGEDNQELIRLVKLAP